MPNQKEHKFISSDFNYAIKVAENNRKWKEWGRIIRDFSGVTDQNTDV